MIWNHFNKNHIKSSCFPLWFVTKRSTEGPADEIRLAFCLGCTPSGSPRVIMADTQWAASGTTTKGPKLSPKTKKWLELNGYLDAGHVEGHDYGKFFPRNLGTCVLKPRDCQGDGIAHGVDVLTSSNLNSGCVEFQSRRRTEVLSKCWILYQMLLLLQAQRNCGFPFQQQACSKKV